MVHQTIEFHSVHSQLHCQNTSLHCEDYSHVVNVRGKEQHQIACYYTASKIYFLSVLTCTEPQTFLVIYICTPASYLEEEASCHLSVIVVIPFIPKFQQWQNNQRAKNWRNWRWFAKSSNWFGFYLLNACHTSIFIPLFPWNHCANCHKISAITLLYMTLLYLGIITHKK